MIFTFLSKNKMFFLFSLTLLISLLPTFSFASYPKLISTITNAFDTIKSWIIRISTPAAAVAVRIRFSYAKV